MKHYRITMTFDVVCTMDSIDPEKALPVVETMAFTEDKIREGCRNHACIAWSGSDYKVEEVKDEN